MLLYTQLVLLLRRSCRRLCAVRRSRRLHREALLGRARSVAAAGAAATAEATALVEIVMQVADSHKAVLITNASRAAGLSEKVGGLAPRRAEANLRELALNALVALVADVVVL